MHVLIEQQRERIAELCRQYGVRQLDIFGSAAGDHFDLSHSDIDVLVEFQPMADASYTDAWFGLHDALARLFGRPVDLVTAQAVRNPYFRAAVEQTRRTMYAA